MYFHQSSFLFLFLFVLKGIIPTQASSLEKDITKQLDVWINSVFGNFESGVMLISRIRSLPYHISEPNKTDSYKKVFPRSTSEDLRLSERSEKVQIDWKFADNKMNLLYDEYIFNIYKLRYARKLVESIMLENFTITASWQNHPDFFKISYNFSYSDSKSKIYKNATSSFWLKNTSSNELTEEQKKETLSRMNQIARNEFQEWRIPGNFESIVMSYVTPKNQLISMHPNFSKHPQQYYYLIPRHGLYGFSMERIVIMGLWNLDSFNFFQNQFLFSQVCTLSFKNIKGKLRLNYERENEAPLKMIFEMDSLSIKGSMQSDQDDNYYLDPESICVQAHRFHIYRAKTKTMLSKRHTEVMKNGIESAIAFSLFSSDPEKKICKYNALQKVIAISNTSDWKITMKEYKELIPFNDDTMN